MKFSIISICYNNRDELEKTMNSVYCQNFTDYEYIVVDGGSGDGTVDLLEETCGKFEQKGVSLRYISEKDNGIYDAMNKGIDMACGQWAIFLNSGDLFCDANVLGKVCSEAKDASDAVYGDAIFQRDDLFKYMPSTADFAVDNGMPYCHQSIFIKTDVLKQYKFMENYRVCNDYEQFIRMYKDKRKFQYMAFPVSVFIYGGLSSSDKGSLLTATERPHLLAKYGIITDEEAKQMEKKTLKRAKTRLAIKKNLRKIGFLFKLSLRMEGWRPLSECSWLEQNQNT